ncbi:redoxin domain-containing protein [Actinophytocola glycyrrhizae]|uniref:Redoxin domain-containing protein n=1 Tax=Actinophytocola glycyrrhizae TaxID=2044873 RepID=A0ABV9RYU9_9PSEU
MGNGARWSIAAVILMIAGVVAIWPRSEPEPTPPRDTTRTATDLSGARAKAALPSCPEGAAGPADLRGITVECLADGGTLDVATALGDRVLVNMWATWCEPCKTELPVLAEYAAGPDAIPVVTLGVESRPGDALELLTALNVRLPSLLDEDGRTRQKLHPIGLPASYLVENGAITLIESPRVFTSADQVRQAVANG